jgi:pimeloyl-ACP methyl ester carboxylesterase
MKKIFLLVLSVAAVGCGKKNNSQEPTLPLTYVSKEITYKSLREGITLAGTLTTPVTDTIKTAVVLINGSGPGDRDYTNRFGHRPFLVMADYLTQHNITVLRYDERGVGKSAGNYKEATFDDLVADATGGVNYLRTLGYNTVGLIGHSQGGSIAPLVALQVKTDFLVLMGSVFTTSDVSLSYQTGTRLKSMNVDEHTYKEIINTVDSLLRILKNETNVNQAVIKMNDLIEQRENNGSINYKNAVEKLGDAKALIDGWLDPKFMYQLHNDTYKTIKKIRIPVLVLYGDDDGVVDVTTNLQLAKTGLDSTAHKIKVFPDLNHLFMRARGIPVEQLHDVDETIAPEVLTTTSDWILSMKDN